MPIVNSNKHDPLLSHNNQMAASFDLSLHEKRLREKCHQDPLLNEKLSLLKQLSQFELGRFLLMNKGLNGYWTAYLILHGPQKSELSELEAWIVKSAPSVKATRERFFIFKHILQNSAGDHKIMASIPCGTMDDLLELETAHFNNMTLVGMDFDPKAIQLAKKNHAVRHHIKNQTTVVFHETDAWQLNESEQFNVIASNGLNIYEPDDDRVIALYRKFYDALQPEGLLVTSFLTPPPSYSKDSPWRHYDRQAALKQATLFADVVGVQWQAYRTEAQTQEQLEKAGFIPNSIQFRYDTQNIFPTVTARKA